MSSWAPPRAFPIARVRYNYAARNALLPSVTAFAYTLGHVLGGSLVTEVVFNYPGLGNPSISASSRATTR